MAINNNNNHANECVAAAEENDELMSSANIQEKITLKSRIALQIASESEPSADAQGLLQQQQQQHQNPPTDSTVYNLQTTTCLKTVGLPLCRDCYTSKRSRLKGSEKLCRFENFRKIYKHNNRSYFEGFPCPYGDATSAEKIELYPTTVDFKKMRPLSVERLTYVLSHIHKSFCKLVLDEESAMKLNLNQNKLLAWKKQVDLVREMCDVCQTTIFNNHWICRNCGLSICIDCYRGRKEREQSDPMAITDAITNGVDYLGWVACTNGKAHIQNQLMLSKILCGDPLLKLSEFSHNLCRSFKIKMNCECTNSATTMEDYLLTDYTEADKDFHKYGRKLYEKTFLNETKRAKWIHEKSIDVLELLDADVKMNVVNYFPGKDMIWQECVVNHKWICGGDVLQLNEPLSPSNTKLFQEQWALGRPTVITQVYKTKEHVWSPSLFSKLVGNQISDIQNCSKENAIISNRPLKFFWDGFETQNNCGMYDEPSIPDVLKLKDWPTKADFAEVLPLQFRSFMNKLPFPQYTARYGFLNLASYLPDNYLKPDLGPKMYSAYASQISPIVGVTNLHIDVSDAINVAVFSSIANCEKDKNELYYATFLLKYKIISLATCGGGGGGAGNDNVDSEMIEQLKLKTEMPCAIWHIWSSKDVDRIREFLNEIKCERGDGGGGRDGDVLKMESNEDPIHDQTFYLDVALRKRLEQEKGVKAYAILQNLGDAILIPAGAPHQVFNLQSCIKVAEDFVSPENVEHCMELTQQFRLLSDSHKNHEDILQMKHILFHSMRSIVSQLIKHIDTLEINDIRKSQRASVVRRPPGRIQKKTTAQSKPKGIKRKRKRKQFK